MSSLFPPRRGPLGVLQDLPAPLAPSFSRRLVPLAATVLHHSRLLPLILCWSITYTKSVQVIPALSPSFSFCKMGPDTSGKFYKVLAISATITETGSQ
jgi:hypothetical protein